MCAQGLNDVAFADTSGVSSIFARCRPGWVRCVLCSHRFKLFYLGVNRILAPIIHVYRVKYTKKRYFLIKKFGASKMHGEYISYVPCTLIKQCTMLIYGLLNMVCVV